MNLLLPIMRSYRRMESTFGWFATEGITRSPADIRVTEFFGSITAAQPVAQVSDETRAVTPAGLKQALGFVLSSC